MPSGGLFCFQMSILFPHLSLADGHTRCGERYASICVQQVDNYGGGSVMIWAENHQGCRVALVHVAGAPKGNYISR